MAFEREALHRMGTELKQWLGMRIHPLAVKLLKNRSEIPEGAVLPTRDWGHKFSLCQSFARSQRNGETIAMFKEDHWCPEPVIGLGFAERIPFFLEGHHRYPDSIRNLQAASEWCQHMPHLGYGLYEGIVSAPIHTCEFMPDLILMHVNGMMTSFLLIVRNWIDGKDLTCQLSGHAVCVYSIVPSLLKRECHVSVPCRGDRRYAFAQDDEILFTLVPEMLPDFIAGIHYLEEHHWGIPFNQSYREEYDLKPKYRDLGEKLGMEMRQSPPRSQKYQKF